MDARTRFIVFGAGACLGAGLLWFFDRHGAPLREHRRAVMASLSLPGMYYDFAVQQKPLFGHFVLAERRSARPGGGIRRELVTGGKNRFDADGRALPHDLILVTEDYAPGVEPAETATVESVSFAYADRAEVAFRQAMAADGRWNARLEVRPDPANPSQAELRLRDAAALRGEALFVLADAIRAAAGSPDVILARLAPIDWRAEADLIRKESGR